MERGDKLILLILSAVLAISFFFDQTIVNSVKDITIESNPLFFLVGYGFITMALAVMTVYYFKNNKKIIIPLLASPIIAAILSIIIKLITGRPRLLIEKFYPRGIPNYSLPSTHVGIVFAIAFILLKQKENLKCYWLTYSS